MPVLANAKHERFAQELAKGKPSIKAFVAAGFKSNEGNASRLKGNEKVAARVAEIQGLAAEKVGITRQWVLTEMAKVAGAPLGDKNVKASDKRAALMDMARIEGWVIEKREHTGKGGGPISVVNLKDLSDDQLAALEPVLAALASSGHDAEGSAG